MRVVVAGGSGLVGSRVLPHLSQHHEVVVFDQKAPRTDVNVEYVSGDVRDFDAATRALTGADTLVFMAMGQMGDWGNPANAAGHFDVAVTGLYLCLRAAREQGIDHAVYTSSMSVYEEQPPATPGELGRLPDESVTPNAAEFYGFAKYLGEQVCANAARLAHMSVVALRLCFPTDDDAFPQTGDRRRTTICTSARDTARAILAALEYRGHGFDAFGISGDGGEQMMSLAKARELLGWQPLDRTDQVTTG